MKKFCIVANSDKEGTISLSEKIKIHLNNKGASCNIIHGYVDKSQVDDETDIIIVLGGDGTLLTASRNLVGLNIPFIGINCGNLGFLAASGPENIEKLLDRLINDDYFIEDRMMISGKIVRNGEVIFEDVALNDIILNRGGKLRIIDFNVYVNGLKLNKYRADGMIVSTPTGSTAYSMSAGGPIVKPSAGIMVITPICPHTFNSRSIVLDADDIVEIEVLAGRNDSEDFRCASFDGACEIPILVNDKILIQKSEIKTSILKLNDESFFEILKRKMNKDEN